MAVTFSAYKAASLPADDVSTIGGAIAASEVTSAADVFLNVLSGATERFRYGKVFVKCTGDGVVASTLSLRNALTQFSAASAMTLVSASASDDATHIAHIVGADASGDLLTEMLPLNGTTEVTGAASFTKVWRVSLIDSEGTPLTAHGAVSVKQGSTPRGSIPTGYSTCSAEVQVGVEASADQTSTNRATAPAGVTFDTSCETPALDTGGLVGVWLKLTVPVGMPTFGDVALAFELAFHALGGTVTIDGDYTVHRFTTDGVLTGAPSISAAILVVGGGGSGGHGNTGTGPGGGGAGEVIESAVYTLSDDMTVTIGTGGTAPSGSGNGSNGGDTVFGPITAKGGGGGGYSPGPGLDGGCGGGGSYSGSAGGTHQHGTPDGATEHQSNGGSVPAISGAAGAGGGGAGGGGYSATGETASSHPGDGGAGYPSAIAGGTPVYYGGGGGGSGGTHAHIGLPAGGAGGSGVGGSGGGSYCADDSVVEGANATAGAANTGSGGGGALTGRTAGSGADGVVIVRYLTSDTPDSAFIEIPYSYTHYESALADEFVDFENVSARDANVALVVNAPTSRIAVISPRGEGYPDKYRALYASVVQLADGHFRAYYLGYDNSGAGYAAIMYADSADGETWTTPDLKNTGDYLGVKRTADKTFNGSAANNIVLLSSDLAFGSEIASLCVVIDYSEADADKRYKFIINEYKAFTGADARYFNSGYYSPDGINLTANAGNPLWTGLVDVGDPKPPGVVDQPTALSYNTDGGRWWAFGQYSSGDLSGPDWREFGANHSDDGLASFTKGDRNPITRTGGTMHGGLYRMMNGANVFLVEIWDLVAGTVSGVRLMSSRGLWALREADASAYVLPLGTSGQWDDGFVCTPSTLSRRYDIGEDWLFYSGLDQAQNDAGWLTCTGKIGLAKYRLAGFTHMALASGTSGTFDTVPQDSTVVAGRELSLNHAGGTITVSLLDMAGNAISGYEESDAITGDALSTVVTWGSDPTLPDEDFIVRITLGTGAKVYAKSYLGPVVSDLTGTFDTDHIDLTFLNDLSVDDFYIVIDRDAGDGYEFLATLSRDAESYVDSALPGSSTFQYRIAVVSAAGYSEWVESNVLSRSGGSVFGNINALGRRLLA